MPYKSKSTELNVPLRNVDGWSGVCVRTSDIENIHATMLTTAANKLELLSIEVSPIVFSPWTLISDDDLRSPAHDPYTCTISRSKVTRFERE